MGIQTSLYNVGLWELTDLHSHLHSLQCSLLVNSDETPLSNFCYSSSKLAWSWCVCGFFWMLDGFYAGINPWQSASFLAGYICTLCYFAALWYCSVNTCCEGTAIYPQSFKVFSERVSNIKVFSSQQTSSKASKAHLEVCEGQAVFFFLVSPWSKYSCSHASTNFFLHDTTVKNVMTSFGPHHLHQWTSRGSFYWSH